MPVPVCVLVCERVHVRLHGCVHVRLLECLCMCVRVCPFVFACVLASVCMHGRLESEPVSSFTCVMVPCAHICCVCMGGEHVSRVEALVVYNGHRL